ncbi:hypothetical protein JCM11251_002479 [Rhodosporidiobolus azoricus]
MAERPIGSLVVVPFDSDFLPFCGVVVEPTPRTVLAILTKVRVTPGGCVLRFYPVVSLENIEASDGDIEIQRFADGQDFFPGTRMSDVFAPLKTVLTWEDDGYHMHWWSCDERHPLSGQLGLEMNENARAEGGGTRPLDLMERLYVASREIQVVCNACDPAYYLEAFIPPTQLELLHTYSQKLYDGDLWTTWTTSAFSSATHAHSFPVFTNLADSSAASSEATFSGRDTGESSKKRKVVTVRLQRDQHNEHESVDQAHPGDEEGDQPVLAPKETRWIGGTLHCREGDCWVPYTEAEVEVEAAEREGGWRLADEEGEEEEDGEGSGWGIKSLL